MTLQAGCGGALVYCCLFLNGCCSSLIMLLNNRLKCKNWYNVFLCLPAAVLPVLYPLFILLKIPHFVKIKMLQLNFID